MKVDGLNKQISHLKKAEDKVNALQTSLNTSETKTRNLEIQYEKLNKEKNKEQELCKKHLKQVELLKNKVSELEDELSVALTSKESENMRSLLEADIVALREQLEECRKEKQKAVVEARSREAEAVKDCQERTAQLQAEMLEQHRKRSVARQEELSEMASLKAEAESLASDLRTSQDEVSERSQRLSDAESALQRERAEVKHLSVELASTKDSLLSAQTLSAESDQRVSSLLNRIELFEENETRLSLEIESLKESAEVRKRELATKTSELQVALRQADVSKEQKEYNKFLSESRATELTELQSRISFLETEKSTASEDVHRLSQRSKELSDRLGNSEALRAQLERRLGDVQRKYDSLYVRMEAITDEHQQQPSTTTTSSSASPMTSSMRFAMETETRANEQRLENEVRQLESSLIEARRQTNLVSGEMKDKTSELERALRNIDTLESKLHEVVHGRSEEVESVKRSYHDLKNAHEKLQREFKQTSDISTSTSIREEELKRRMKSAESEVTVLRESMAKTSSLQDERDGLKVENTELRNQLRETTSLLRHSNSSDMMIGRGDRSGDRTDILTRRIKELEMDLQNTNQDNALREKEYRSALDSEMSAKKHADRLQYELSVESARKLQLESDLKTVRSQLTVAESELSQLKRSNMETQSLEAIDLRGKLRVATNDLNEIQRKLLNSENQRTKLDTSLTKAESTISKLSAEVKSLRESLLEKEDEVRGLLALNEQLLVRAEKALEKSRESKKKKLAKERS
jgi:chromosome segregation ATPase